VCRPRSSNGCRKYATGKAGERGGAGERKKNDVVKLTLDPIGSSHKAQCEVDSCERSKWCLKRTTVGRVAGRTVVQVNPRHWLLGTEFFFNFFFFAGSMMRIGDRSNGGTNPSCVSQPHLQPGLGRHVRLAPESPHHLALTPRSVATTRHDSGCHPPTHPWAQMGGPSACLTAFRIRKESKQAKPRQRIKTQTEV